jgi:hypothetical protein
VRLIDHDHRQAERTGGRDLCVGGGGTGVLGNKDVNGALAHQGDLIALREGAALQNELSCGWQLALLWRIDRANDVSMLLGIPKRANLLPPDGEKDALWCVANSCRCSFGAVHTGPVVTFLLLPRGAQERGERQFHATRGLNGIARYPSGKGMRRIYDCLDSLCGKPVGEAIGSAKSADARGDGLGKRSRCPSRQGKCELEAIVVAKPPRQLESFTRATENEYSHDRL